MVSVRLTRRMSASLAASLAACTVTAAIVAVPAASEASPQPNRSPQLTVRVATPDPNTGAVRIRVRGVDADSPRLRLRFQQVTGKGSVSLRFTRSTTSTGAFTYTPSTEARHAAAADDAGPSLTTDSFRVSFSDGEGGRTRTTVSVPVVPQNAVPTVGPSVGSPNPATGVVTGSIGAADTDGDALGYEVTTIAANGSVGVNPDGTFIYTPTAAARHAAAAPGATAADTTDTFTVTVTDGYGGTVEAPVAVPIAPAAT